MLAAPRWHAGIVGPCWFLKCLPHSIINNFNDRHDYWNLRVFIIFCKLSNIKVNDRIASSSMKIYSNSVVANLMLPPVHHPTQFQRFENIAEELFCFRFFILVHLRLQGIWSKYKGIQASQTSGHQTITTDGWNPAITSRYGKYSIIYRDLYIPGGVGALPSTVWPCLTCDFL